MHFMPIDVTANFIRIRVASPKLFTRFAVKTLGKGIKAVIGFKSGGGSQIQSFLFPKSSYTLATAKAWIKSHDYSVSETVECYLVTDIIVGPEYLEFEETLITPELEKEMLKEEPISVLKMKKETWAWLLE